MNTHDEDLEIEIESGPEIVLEDDNDHLSKDEPEQKEDTSNPYDDEEDQGSSEANKAARLGKSAKRSRNIRAKLDRADVIEYENRIMKEELARLKQEQQNLSNLAKQFTSETLDGKLTQTNDLIQYYQKEYATAVSNADGDTSAHLMGMISDKQQEAAQLKWQKQQLANANHQSAPQQAVEPLQNHPETKFYKSRFLQSHPWISEGRDTDDINLVLQIDEQVAQEGYRMNSPAYWDRLESKMKEYMPERFEAQARSQYQPRKSHVGASVTNSAVMPSERNRMSFTEQQAELLVRMGYLGEDRKTQLNRDKVKEYHNTWKRVKGMSANG